MMHKFAVFIQTPFMSFWLYIQLPACLLHLGFSKIPSIEHIQTEPLFFLQIFSSLTLLFLSKWYQSTKIQLTIKLRRKKGNFIWAKLRIITREADSQKVLRTVLPVRRRRNSHIPFWDKGSYIKMTYRYFTLSSPRIYSSGKHIQSEQQVTMTPYRGGKEHYCF